MAGLALRKMQEQRAAAEQKTAKLKQERTQKFYEAWATKMVNLGQSAASTFSWTNGKLNYHHGAGVNFVDSNYDGIYSKGEQKVEGKIEEIALWNQFKAEAGKYDVPIDLEQFQRMWQEYNGIKSKAWNESVQFAMASGAPSKEFHRVLGEDPKAMKDALAVTSNPALLGIDVSTEGGQLQLANIKSFLFPNPEELRGDRLQDDPMGWYNRMLEENPLVTGGATVAAGYGALKFGPKLLGKMKGLQPGLFSSLAAKQATQFLGGAAGLSDQQARIAGGVAGGGVAAYGIKKHLAANPEVIKAKAQFKTQASNVLSKGSKETLLKNAKALGVDDKIVKGASRKNASKVNINKVRDSIKSTVKSSKSARILLANTTKKKVVGGIAKSLVKKTAIKGGMSLVPGGAVLAGAWTLYDIADAAGFVPDKLKFWK